MENEFDDINLNEGGEYINAPGDYDVQIMSAKPVNGKTNGTPGVKYGIKTEAGQGYAVDFWLSDAAKPRLRSFAVACGLTTEEMEHFNPAQLVGKQVNVTFEPQKSDARYLELVKWEQVIKPFKIDDGMPF